MPQPRRFDSLRHRAPEPITTGQEEPIESVIKRLFLTGIDGPRVMAWMLDQVDDAQSPNAPEAVLRDADGQRRFVQRLRRICAGEGA